MQKFALVTLLILTLAAIDLQSQEPTDPPVVISEQNDLAHRNPDIHWLNGSDPARAQSFSHNTGYIDVSCEKTFTYLDNPRTWPSYLVFAQDVQLESTGPLAKGSRFRWTIFGNPIESEIVELQPPWRIAWINLKSKFYQTWLLQPKDHGCQVTTEELGVGSAAAQRTARGDTSTHRAHDLWLASLRWIAEGDTSSK